MVVFCAYLSNGKFMRVPAFSQDEAWEAAERVLLASNDFQTSIIDVFLPCREVRAIARRKSDFVTHIMAEVHSGGN